MKRPARGEPGAAAANAVIEAWRDRPTVRAVAVVRASADMLDQLMAREAVPADLVDQVAELRQLQDGWLDWAGPLAADPTPSDRQET